MIEGLDSDDTIPASVIKAAGKSFTCRYTHNLSKAEAENLRSGGISLALIFEDKATDYLGGFAQGTKDATTALQQIAACGLTAYKPVVYFTVDAEATDLELADDYFSGCASVIGLDRCGAYGDIAVITSARNSEVAKFFYQTLAWSDGQIAPWAHVYQYAEGDDLDGYGVDLDRTVVSDTNYGQVQYQPIPAPTPEGEEMKCGLQAYEGAQWLILITPTGLAKQKIPSTADLTGGLETMGAVATAFSDTTMAALPVLPGVA